MILLVPPTAQKGLICKFYSEICVNTGLAERLGRAKIFKKESLAKSAEKVAFVTLDILLNIGRYFLHRKIGRMTLMSGASCLYW